MAYSDYNTMVNADAPLIRHTFETNYANTGSVSVTTTSDSPTRNAAFAAAGSNVGVYFDGSISRLVDTTSNGFFDDKTFTVEAWIKNDGTGGDYQHIVRRSFGASHFLLRVRGASLGVSPGVAEIYYSTDSGNITIYSGVRVDDNVWHHIVAVAEGNGSPMRLYVDGVLKDFKTIPAGVHSNQGSLNIGCHYDGSSYSDRHKGSIDEVAIYGQALTATRVTEHYNAGSAPPAVNVSFDAATATSTLNSQDVTVDSNVISATHAKTKLKYVDDANGGYGTTAMYIGGSRQSYVQFDLSNLPFNADVYRAYLKINAGSALPTDADDLTIKRVTSSWVETDAANPSVTATDQKVIDARNMVGDIVIDITNIVKSWDAGSANHGIQIDYSGLTQSTLGINPTIETQYTVAPVSVTVDVATGSLSLAGIAETVTAQRNIDQPVATATVSLAGISESAVSGSAVSNVATATSSVTSHEATAEVVISPNATLDVATATALVQSHDATVSIPAIVELTETGNVSVGANEPVVEMTQSAQIDLDTPRIDVTHYGLTDVNGQPIVPTEEEDPYFVSTMRTLDAADFWYRLDERSGTTAYDRAKQAADGTPEETLVGKYSGVTIGMNEAPESRHSVYFNGQASLATYDPANPFSNIDEQFSTPSTLEFSIRTERGTQFIMGGSDQRKGTTTATAVGPSEFWLNNGKINFRGYNFSAALVTNIVGFTNLADGEWHHVVVNSGGRNTARGSDYIEIYVDGKLEIRRFAGVQGTSTNETVETGNIYFGMPDDIGARTQDYGDAAYKLPALGATQWFLGDMTEVIYRNLSLLSEDQILLQRDNFFGIKPVYTETPTLSVKAVEASAKGNKTRVLVLDFQTAATATFTGPDPYAGRDAFGNGSGSGSGGATIDFPALRRQFDSSYGEAGINAEAYQFFTVPVRNNYLDPVTDNERVLDLDVDVNMDDFDILAIGGFPQNDAQWAWYTGMDEYSTAPYVPGKLQVEHLMNQVRSKVIAGKRLFVNDPASAVMLGIVDRAEFVPNLREGVINDNRLGSNVGLYDYRADQIDPFSTKGDPDRYRDQHANTRQRVRKLIDGLTSLPGWEVSDYVEWFNVDPLGTPPYQETFKYINRPDGYSIGDEFFMHGAQGPYLLDWWDEYDGTPTSASRPNGWVAAPMANVKVGSVVTSFASNIYALDQIQTNAYKDYAISIVVEQGDSWAGQTVQGRVYVNFTEAFTQWASFGETLQRQILPATEEEWAKVHQNAYNNPVQRLWDFSTHRGTWTGTTLQADGSGGVAISLNSKGEVSLGNAKSGKKGDGLVVFNWQGFFPHEEVSSLSMAHRGLKWLASELDLDGNATVGNETPEVVATANDVTVEVSRAVEIDLSTARSRTEAIEMSDVVPADATVLVDTPAVTLKTGAFREVIDLSTAKITVKAVEPFNDIMNNVDLITLTLPVHQITIYMEDK